MSLKRALVIPDTHRPFHSRKAYNLMLEVALYQKIDEVVLLGDYADYYSVSAHGSKDPSLPHLLEREVLSVNEGLDEIDRLFPKAKKVYLAGNHEYRLERYIFDKAPALFGLTSCRELFQIAQRPLWSYLDYQKNQAYRVLASGLIARHTPLASGAVNGLRRASASYIHGHTHQISETHVVSLEGKDLVALCPGWLGDVRSSAFSYLASPPQWQLGFCLVSCTSSSKQFHHELVQIKSDYTCVSSGKLFRA